MEYTIYRHIGDTPTKEFVGKCFTDDDEEVLLDTDILQVKEDLEHYGYRISPNAKITAPKFIFVEDGNQVFEFVPHP